MKRWLSLVALAAPLAVGGAALAQSEGGGSADTSASTAAQSAGKGSTTDTGRWPSSSGATQGAAGPADTAYGSGGNEEDANRKRSRAEKLHQQKKATVKDAGAR